MPFYDFECLSENGKHERIFTVRHSYDEPHPICCPTCGSPVRQIFSAVPAHYKGIFANRSAGRVRGESGALGRRVSETDISNIDDETPTRLGTKGRPKMTPTRPRPMKARKT